MVRGTMAAVVPIEDPTIIRVRGIMATIKMIKGVERVALTMAPKIRFTTLFSIIWPLPVTVRITPKGIPNNVARAAETTTM